MKNFEILEMNLNDFLEIEDSLEDQFDNFWTCDTLKRELINENSLYFVAKINKKVVGFAGFFINFDFVEINNIVVKKDCRNKGIGKLLLEKIINETKKLKKEYICLEVNENNDIAINLYKKFNFKEVGLRKKYYKNDNAILMNLKIN